MAVLDAFRGSRYNPLILDTVLDSVFDPLRVHRAVPAIFHLLQVKELRSYLRRRHPVRRRGIEFTLEYWNVLVQVFGTSTR